MERFLVIVLAFFFTACSGVGESTGLKSELPGNSDTDPTPVPVPIPNPNPNTNFRGIPERPFANVQSPAVGTVAVGASNCTGTASSPAFIVGNGEEFVPADDKWEITAVNCIIVNVNIRGRIRFLNSSNSELRDSEVKNAGGNAVFLNGSSLAVVNTHIHHSKGNNGHGVQASCGSSKIWVERNLLEYNDEDGFQSGHRCDGNRPDEIYFYGNTCNNNRENCFDLKWTERAVASGNVMLRHRTAQSGVVFTYDDGSTDGGVDSGSDGAAVVIGSDGTPNTTFMFDNVYEHNMGCVRIEDAVDVYASGEACKEALANSGWGGYKFDKSGHTRIVNSFFTNVPFMFMDNFRAVPVVDEAGNTAVNAGFRSGFNSTMNSGNISEQTITDAYLAHFGRNP